MSLASKQLVDSLMVVRNRNNNLKEECQKHLTMSLEKAKKRYQKVSEVNMIELNENGVVRKILLPPTSITQQGAKKKENSGSSAHSVTAPTKNRGEYLHSVVRSAEKAILPNSSVSNVNSSQTTLLAPSARGISNTASISTNYITFSQQNAFTTNAGIQPYASVSNSPSVQTVMIINPQFNQQTRPFKSSTLQQQQQQQQPFIITQRAVTPNCNSGFILQQSPAQLPSFYQPQNQISQFQLVNQHPAFINQNFSAINQGFPSIQVNPLSGNESINLKSLNEDVKKTSTESKKLKVTEYRVIQPKLRGMRSLVVVLNDFSTKFQGHQTQTFVLNQPMISNTHPAPMISSSGPATQGAHVVEIVPVSNSAQISCNSDKNAKQKLKPKKILPKGSGQNKNTANVRSKSSSPNKQSLSEKIETPAKKSNDVLFMIANKSPGLGDPGQPLKVQLVERTPEKPTDAISVNVVESKPKNTITLKRKLDKCNPIAKSPGIKKAMLDSPFGKERPLKRDLTKSSSFSNNKIKTNVKLNPKLVVSHVTGSTDLRLTKHTPTVVLSPLNIQVNPLGGNESINLKSLNEDVKKTSTESKKLKVTEYRVIQPKPSGQLASLMRKDAKKMVATTERRQIKNSQAADDLESDFAIAQILDKEEKSCMWIDDDEDNDDDDGGREDDESELEQKKKRRGGKFTDKSYKCHMTRAAEPTKYPRTRSSRCAKRKA